MQLLYLCCVFGALVVSIHQVSGYPKRRQFYRYELVPHYPQYIRGYRSAYPESRYPMQILRGYNRQMVQPRQVLPLDCNHCAEDPIPASVPQFESEPIPSVNEDPNIPEVEIEPTKIPEVPKKVAKKPDTDESDDSEDPGVFGKVPIYNTFFPMNFARGFTSPNGRSPEGEGAGGAMAIANSYSTGRGGVATSHATAYGSPSPQLQ